MITWIKGNIFYAPTEALVNPVNCVGVSGKGLAKDFKLKFPDNEKAYTQQCKLSRLVPGECFPFKTSTGVWVLNVATKDHWRNPSKLTWIEQCCNAIREFTVTSQITSVAVPALGCGNGGLSWDIVKQCMINSFEAEEFKALVYEPQLIVR